MRYDTDGWCLKQAAFITNSIDKLLNTHRTTNHLKTYSLCVFWWALSDACLVRIMTKFEYIGYVIWTQEALQSLQSPILGAVTSHVILPFKFTLIQKGMEWRKGLQLIVGVIFYLMTWVKNYLYLWLDSCHSFLGLKITLPLQ